MLAAGGLRPVTQSDRMEQLRRLAKIGLGGLAFLVYFWVAGVRFSGEVCARKDARRRALTK